MGQWLSNSGVQSLVQKQNQKQPPQIPVCIHTSPANKNRGSSYLVIHNYPNSLTFLVPFLRLLTSACSLIPTNPSGPLCKVHYMSICWSLGFMPFSCGLSFPYCGTYILPCRESKPGPHSHQANALPISYTPGPTLGY